MSNLRTAVVIDLTGNLERRAQRYSRSLGQFSERGQRHMSLLARSAERTGKLLDGMTNRYVGALSGVAGGYAAYRQVVNSAQLDKQLIRIRQTAGATTQQAAALRTELHAMSEATGQSLDSLLAGFNNLIQSGLSWEQSLATIQAVNPAMAVTGAQAEVLSSALTVAAEAFKFDLSQSGKAVELLDQMTVAGRLGNAELEDLSGIFARVGVNAKAAGLGFSDTLGFIEQLSLIEKQPERLATLADSTLRLFTNQKYLQTAADATGVSFYNADGEKRAAFDVLRDIGTQYQKLRTDRARDTFISNAFGQADLDTIKGLRSLLSGNAIDKARTMSEQIAGSTGTIEKDLKDALDNSVDQVARLKAALGGAADEFAKPVNDAVENAIKYLLDEKGLNLSGEELLVGGAAGAATLFGALKGGGKLLQKFGGVGAGVAAGKVLEEVAGVTPVYVVNMPGSGFPGLDGPARAGGGRAGRIRTPGRWQLLRAAPSLSSIGTMGAGAVGTAGAYVAGAGLAGYGIGTLINDYLLTDQGPLGTETGDKIGEAIGRSLHQVLAFFGDDDAQAALDAEARLKRMEEEEARAKQMRGEVVVRVRAEQGAEARTERPYSNSNALALEVETEAGVRAGGMW